MIHRFNIVRNITDAFPSRTPLSAPSGMKLPIDAHCHRVVVSGRLTGNWVWMLAWALVGFFPAIVARADDSAEPQFTPEAFEFFEREVRPLLLEHCASCHSASVENVKGGLSLDSRDELLQGGESGEAIVPGKPDESLLVEAIRRESFEMPPEKPLNDKARLTLERWVEMGAPWTPQSSQPSDGANWLEQRAATHWAWQPIADPAVPALENDRWSQQPLDRFVLQRLRSEGLEPAPRADATTLLRRLSFDITGLPPTEEQIEACSQLTESPAAYVQLVDHLLASPQLGVRWGRHCLDLVRYAETLGHEFDYPIRHAWRYRDGVIDALNIDMPYRDFVQEHIAGDLLDEHRTHPLTGIDQSRVATGWWWLGESLHAPVDIKNDWALRLDNQIDVFSKAFLGMTVACARCHDHKFDAIGVADYYGLSGIIESTRREYALTDPSGAVGKHRRNITQQIETADAEAKRVYGRIATAELENWLTALLAKLQTLDEAQQQAALPNASPLVGLRLLLDRSAPANASAPADAASPAAQAASAEHWSQQAIELKSQLEAARVAFDAWERESELFADFSDGLPAGWTVNAVGESTSSAPFDRRPQYDWFSAALPLPMRSGVLSSQALGRKASVTIGSPTFDVSRTHVCVKLRGKSTQSAVVVSNYFMQEFHGLLFGDLRKPIDQPSDAGWVTHAGDLNKYLGHPAFLTFEDEEQAWFELEEIRFADRAPPLEEPSKFALQVLDAHVAERGAFRQLFLQRLAHAWEVALAGDKSSIETIRSLVQLSAAQGVALPVSQSELLAARATEIQQLDAAGPVPTIVLAATEGTGRDAAVAVRGNPHQRGESVVRGCLVKLVSADLPGPSSSGRLELAQSLVGEGHPLTARVIVNRVWHHLLGRGLASTPDNLGVLGGRPLHPELLDYLTSEFIRHAWSIKWLVREIVLSETYQLSSQPTEAQRTLDADGRLLSHRAVRRLSAEALRDAMLATAGALDPQLSGPSVPVYLTDQMTGRGRPGGSGPMDGSNRRTVFIEVRRNFLNPFLMAFDFPMPATSVGDRNASNVPAQALGLLNDPLTAELAKRWAESSAGIEDPRQRAAWMVQAAFSRPASEQEIDDCSAFVEGDPAGWRDLAHVLLNAKEFSYLK